MKIKLLIPYIWGFSLLITVNLSFSQNGDRRFRKWGQMDGNLINTPFINYGMIGNWPWSPDPSEWPKGSGHTYLEGATPMIAAEIVDVNGNTIHTIVSGYREDIDTSPEGVPQGLEPLPGFHNPDGSSIAMSHLPETWPSFWPDKLDDPTDPGWPGSWNGFFGKNVFRADQESYFVMDDDKDEEFEFFPDSTDSSRRGLGLQIGVRGLQWAEFLVEDIIFWHYTITNEGTTNYDNLIFGIYFDSGIGGIGDSGDDSADFDSTLALAFAWDMDNTGNTGFSPVAFMGISLLEDPGNVGVTSFTAVGLHQIGISDDEHMWDALTPGNITAGLENRSLAVIFGSGFFSLNAGETKTAAVALVFGEDLDDLKRNASFARSFYNGGFSFDTHDVSITSPIGGETLSGSVDINWSASGTGDPLEVGIYYSFDDGNTWTVLADNEPNDGTFSWDTTPLVDGIFYRLMVAATNNEGVGTSISDTSFTINNPVAAVPQVILQSPVGGEEISGMHNITWRAGDADGDMVSVLVLSSTDGGETFNLFSGEDNDGQFEWDTNPLPNGSNYKIKLVVSDGALMGEDQSDDVFQVNNQRFPLSDFYPDTLGVAHVAGPGTGSVQVNIVFPLALTYHIYEISFDDTSGDQTTYDVFDLTLGEFVILDAQELTSGVEGPLFDGIRLLIEDVPIELIEEETRWIAGDSNFDSKVQLGVNVDPYPADYDITFFDEVIGTDSSSTPIDVNFTVMNITENRPANFRFQDLNGDGFWSSNDRMRIRELFEGAENRTWLVTLWDTTGTGGQPPGGGDVFQIRTTKPFRSGDVFRFPEVITAIAFWPDETNLPYTYSLLQNYPNPFNPETTIQYSLAASGRVVIHIYNILGQKVMTLVDDVQEEGFHKVQWDGKDNFGRNIASGVYLYRIRSGDFVHTRKLLLLR